MRLWEPFLFKPALRWKGLFYLTVYTSSYSQSRSSQRQEPMQRPWRSVAYCLDSHGSLSLLPYGVQDYQSLGKGHHPQWAGPFYIYYQPRECTPGFPTGLSIGDIFSIEVPSFPVNLCQIDNKLASTSVTTKEV